jgi:hypothetical protein
MDSVLDRRRAPMARSSSMILRGESFVASSHHGAGIVRCAAAAAMFALSLAAPATARSQESSPEPAPTTIQAQPLGALDLFQAGVGGTGLAPNLWQGTSAALARDVFDRLGDKPLSPAARRTALALLRTSATAPDGAAADVELAGARVRALLALGDPAGVDAILDRTSGVAGSAVLSQAAAEASLYLGQDEEACRLGQEAQEGRDQPFFVRLRAYCDAVAGRTAQAQLALSLVEQGAGRDATFARLLGALLAGEGASPGAASLQTALHTALSRRLALDLAPAVPKASRPGAKSVALSRDAPVELRAEAAKRAGDPEHYAGAPLFVPPIDNDRTRLFREAQAAFGATPPEEPPTEGAEPTRAKVEQVALLLAAAGNATSSEGRLALMRLQVPPGDAGVARRLALDVAAQRGRKGEVALIALDIAMSAPDGRLKLADSIEIVRAMRQVGLDLGRDWLNDAVSRVMAAPK